jgi:phosphate transport system substrate-binding protein
MKQNLSMVALWVLVVAGNGALIFGQSVSREKPAVKGGGATLPAPLYQIAIADFEERHPNGKMQILYNQQVPFHTPRPFGSEEGIRLVRGNGLDFAGTDWPLTEDELRRYRLVQFPMAVGGIAIIYNLPEITKPEIDTFHPLDTPTAEVIHLRPETIARIFQGSITRWNDALIRRDNPTLKTPLPSVEIIPVYRLDGSGTTYILTNFFSAGGGSWAGGSGFTVKKWAPGGIAAAGSEAMADTVAHTRYSIGYAENDYAQRQGVVAAELLVKMSDAVKPVAAENSTFGAALSKDAVGRWAKGELTDSALQALFPKTENTPSAPRGQSDPYPISGVTWVLVKQNLDPASRDELCEFLKFLPGWLDTNASTYNYAPLPANAREVTEQRIKAICK